MSILKVDSMQCVSTDTSISMNNAVYFPTGTLTDGATINWNVFDNPTCQVTLGGNRTLAAPTNMVDGGFYSILIIQDGTGSRTLTFNSCLQVQRSNGSYLDNHSRGKRFINF
jgi:hypothetical protein